MGEQACTFRVCFVYLVGRAARVARLDQRVESVWCSMHAALGCTQHCVLYSLELSERSDTMLTLTAHLTLR